MKKIIHMSDLHIGYRDFEDRFINVIDHLVSELPLSADEYVVIITGDLVHNATKKGSYEAAKKGLDYLRKKGFRHILVVPGNHDYGTGSKGNKKFVQLFKEVFYCAEIEYPKVDIIDDVALIGLDSMSQEVRWYNDLWAEGQIGKKQLNNLEEILNDPEIQRCAKRVIYLHHHPFKWRPFHQLKDARKLKKVLTGIMKKGVSIDAMLFGHNHEGKAHNNKWGILRCYDAGTTTLKPRPKYVKWSPWFTVKASTRVIALDKEPDNDYRLPYLYHE